MSLAVGRPVRNAGITAPALDEDGFLLDRRLWSRDVAQQLADRNGLGTLGPHHWLIIDFVRDRYYRLGALPPMRNLCRKLGVDRGAVNKAFGSCRVLWEVAGLPNPGGETLSYME